MSHYLSLRIFTVIFSLMLCSFAALGETINRLPQQLSQLPEVIDSALETFYTPGMAVGIIKDGKVVYLAGHGKRDLANDLPVTPETYFRLASTTKAFTGASVAMLVDDGKLQWRDRVTRYLPEFAMQDPWVTREFQIIDLLTHRSGLVSGAGDSMLWPEPSGFTRSEIIHNLRYLTPQSSFRSDYAYSNVMYITAGELVASISDQPWEEFVAKRIFAPLDMSCFAGDMPPEKLTNAAVSYGHNDKRGIYPVVRNQIGVTGIVSAAAGGIACNATDMLKWVQMWLNKGKSPDGNQLLTDKSIDTMLSAHTVLSVDDTDKEWDHTLFKAYGIGWRLSDVFGHQVISHTGTLSGYQAYVAFVPDISAGVVILNNGSNYGARGAVMQTILKGYLTAEQPQQNWIKQYQVYQDKQEQIYLSKHSTPQGSGTVILPLEKYTGTFEDRWFGQVEVTQQGDKLRLKAKKMPTLRGSLEPFDDHTFVVRWDNQNAASDAFAHFRVNTQREVIAVDFYPFTDKVKANHEYRDMHFIRMEAGSGVTSVTP
ncbi:serine hydrolase [Alteromonas pelagimontana]|uniref:Serine hydrolase n=1 Tax=Alteromonas pelagimontana TaxID=1858656 RepID=A0A6M4MFL2_9ALTE|nr:serine hydrolase [Alteromonas pelagimontana]QJR81944.1 serine hydrolase [Alteromonas pelagimontana]